MNEEQPINVQVRVAGRNGWISVFTGESRGKALERILPSLNARGYRVAFVIEDKFSFLRGLLNIVLAIVTLGFYWQSSELIIIGERIDMAEQKAEAGLLGTEKPDGDDQQAQDAENPDGDDQQAQDAENPDSGVSEDTST